MIVLAHSKCPTWTFPQSLSITLSLPPSPYYHQTLSSEGAEMQIKWKMSHLPLWTGRNLHHERSFPFCTDTSSVLERILQTWVLQDGNSSQQPNHERTNALLSRSFHHIAMLLDLEMCRHATVSLKLGINVSVLLPVRFTRVPLQPCSVCVQWSKTTRM